MEAQCKTCHYDEKLCSCDSKCLACIVDEAGTQKAEARQAVSFLKKHRGEIPFALNVWRAIEQKFLD